MTEQVIYQGTRGQEFKSFITGLLSRGKITPRYMDILTSESSMKEYDKAFTGKDANMVNNYENYENMGDVSANKFIVWYAYKRFPQLDCPDGVAVVARLRINYGSKASFGRIGDRLGFWPFITETQDKRNVAKKTLIEDCFEAFIGCTEHLLDKHTRVGVGYAIVYDILKSIFDEETISLEYNDLYDSLTRLKEVFDTYHWSKLGSYAILTNKNEEKRINTSIVYLAKGQERATPDTGPQFLKGDKKPRPQAGWIQLGEGEAPLLSNAQQKAAEQAIITLKTMGFSKPVPEKYKLFCNVKK
jgi:dsRNA-specific ribonuclease